MYIVTENCCTKALQSDLVGEYQVNNLRTALCIVQKIKHMNYHISNNHVFKGLLNSKETTDFKGRWHVLSNKPLTICDPGHNQEGMAAVLKQISKTPYHKLHFVIGVVGDKSLKNILVQLPKKATYYFTKANIPRALPVNSLMDMAVKLGLKGTCYDSVQQAINTAQQKAGKDDLVFVGGSTFIVAEAV